MMMELFMFEMGKKRRESSMKSEGEKRKGKKERETER